MSNDRPAAFLRSNELLSRQESRLLIVDVQEKLWAAFATGVPVVRNCRKLIAGAHILGIPVQATEQYPKGLGRTVPELAELVSDVVEKVRFSASEALGWSPAGGIDHARDKIVIAGLEAHVCVLQTAFDLISLGYRVFIPADAVASRSKVDSKIALRRLSDGGVTVTTTESVLFEWCEAAGTDEFKLISRLITERS